jgi:hypothetical protein
VFDDEFDVGDELVLRIILIKKKLIFRKIRFIGGFNF